jgi:hypothetical protein
LATARERVFCPAQEGHRANSQTFFWRRPIPRTLISDSPKSAAIAFGDSPAASRRMIRSFACRRSCRLLVRKKFDFIDEPGHSEPIMIGPMSFTSRSAAS